jgi:hypothetical protein
MVNQIVVASSDKAYGDQERLAYDENSSFPGGNIHMMQVNLVQA